MYTRMNSVVIIYFHSRKRDVELKVHDVIFRDWCLQPFNINCKKLSELYEEGVSNLTINKEIPLIRRIKRERFDVARIAKNLFNNLIEVSISFNLVLIFLPHFILSSDLNDVQNSLFFRSYMSFSLQIINR
jgi:hypothetical protein